MSSQGRGGQRSGKQGSGKRRSGKERSGKERSGKQAKSAKKTSLPAFGFSDDLLKGKKAAPSPPDEQEATAAKKASLPAFGFAEDLLKELKGETAADGETAAAGVPADGETAADGAGGPSPTGTAAAGVAQGEERIFAFTDSLEASAEEEERKAPVRLRTWVTFKLAGEIFALPVEPVHEVVRPTVVTRVPHAPYPIRGVTNLRGRVVPLIDLRLRLELPESDIARSSRIVVVGSRGRRLGLLVDAVHQVVHLEVDRIQPPPDDVMTVQSDYITGVYHMGEELILLLDVDRVLIIKEPSPAPGGTTAGRPAEEAAAGEPAAGEPAAGAA